mmetsp:Transcript_65511/g.152111  ORF Transcript_65511/g.152111 Transcript_65511/m.152111 type:complete len:200 (+) Transcript_65511:3022-3621(+)
MASARRTMMVPGVVGTSKTSASSSKGFNSSVPWMGPKGKRIMSLCRKNVVSHVEASSRPSSGCSSADIPVSWTRPAVRVGQRKPKSPMNSLMMDAVSDMAASSFVRPTGASELSWSGIPRSMIRADPSRPSSPSTIISGGRCNLLVLCPLVISSRAFLRSASRSPGFNTQKPLVCKQLRISRLTPVLSPSVKLTSHSDF